MDDYIILTILFGENVVYFCTYIIWLSIKIMVLKSKDSKRCHDCVSKMSQPTTIVYTKSLETCGLLCIQ